MIVSLGSSTLASTSGDECGYAPRQCISLDDIFRWHGLEDRHYADEHRDLDSPLQTPQSLRSPEASDEDNKTPQHHREPVTQPPAVRRCQAGSAATVTPHFTLQRAVFTPSSAENAGATNPQQPPTAGPPTQHTPHSRHYPAAQLPPGLRIQQPAVPPMVMPAATKTLPLFHGDYSNSEEPAHWFVQFQLALLDTWSEAAKIHRFQLQLAPGGYTDEWFNKLPASDRASLAAIRMAFLKQWPPMKHAKWLKLQQKERVREQGLKEEEVGKWVQEGRVGDYGQNVWVDRVMRLALSMGNMDGSLIEYAIETALAALKDHLEDGYDSWEDFIQAVREIPAARLRRSKEELEQNRAHNSAIASLKQQVAQLTVRMALSSQQSTSRLSPSPSYSSLFPSAQAHTQGMPASTTVAGSPQWCNLTPLKGPLPPHISLLRAQIIKQVSGIPQRSNTDEGRRLWEADVDIWHHMHGRDAPPSLERPYPLKPGTAALGSGECFSCGMITDPPHISGTCQATEQLRPLESRWRQLVTGMLRRATLPRTPTSQVQYVWPVSHPASPAIYASTPIPVQLISTYHEEDIRDAPYTVNTSGYGNVTWDWSSASENGGGLQQAADQQ